MAQKRFYLGFTTGTASAGQSKFVPASQSYPNLSSPQYNQNYSMYVVGDVASTFANRPD